MENWRDLKAHPAAAVLPMMTGPEREKLKASIEHNGYHPNEPIVLLDGLIVDGRNRHALCCELDIVPVFEEYAGDPDDIGTFVLNKNVETWRDLSPIQKALVFLQMNPFVKQHLQGQVYDKPGRPKKSASIEADFSESRKPQRWTEEAGKKCGVSRGTMDRAVFIHEKAPEVGREIVAGARKGKVMDELAKLGWVDSTNGMPPKPKKSRKKEPAKPRPETMELAQWEGYIEGRLEAFLDVAHALIQIRDGRLYCETHGEFFRYLADRWGLTFKRDGSLVLMGMDAVTVANQRGEDR